MKIGVILTTDDPERLYVAGTYIATELARGNEVVVFITGRATLAFSKRGKSEESEPIKKMRELKVYWDELFKAAKPMGVKCIACETATKIFGVSEEEYDKELVDEVSSMYTFLEEVGDGRVVVI
ncbi:hypothetical protein Pogu_1388 [Pyrobaculum oguniense TE7]|uniref:Uncharacterized protein n=1 Tax=Pyrobaculum oguniense (strain DSM 13380 / JCM 10595 / TE7) TaxID=698757 RepID=H6Q934_PYROT|nr:hypothetical protein Pogu_1388 [Pyrobaculum oguniense TE7]